ncbi:MAG: enoyl-CoA hydratase-related protein, partial [Dehalococcoidia bacterium]|nr:enoyl-CoA hydratase-related protein [Dehalococcoidia bacterium]
TGDTTIEIGMAMSDASHDSMVGVLVVGGVGDHFGSGGDVNWEQAGGLRGTQFQKGIDDFIRMCRKPVIAMVQGYCIGGSHHFAYMCDFTIAADDAVFGQNGARVGSPADGYYLPYLARVVGAKKAREIWMFARRYTAQEALELGLANKVVPRAKLEEEVDNWCDELLKLSPDCIEVYKATFDHDIEYLAGMSGMHQRLMIPWWHDSPDLKEAGNAFVERREPDFWKYRKDRK